MPLLPEDVVLLKSMVREVIEDAQRPKGPLWLQILREFGFPILVAIAAGYWIYHQDSNFSEERTSTAIAQWKVVSSLREDLAGISAIPPSMSRLEQEVRRLSDYAARIDALNEATLRLAGAKGRQALAEAPPAPK